MAASMETVMLCHTKAKSDDPDTEPQCAGSGIYRANCGKLPRDRSILMLPKNTEDVFSNSQEFMNHHERKWTPTATS